MAGFGYLNEGNPFNIGDTESQEMYNCRIERGFIEYSEFEVPQGLYDSTPGRSVTLPNGKEVVVDITGALATDQSYAGRGKLRVKSGETFSRLGIAQPGVYSGLSIYQPVYNTDYKNITGSILTQSGKYTYTIQLQLEGSTDIGYEDTFVFRYITLNGVQLSPDAYSWFAGAAGSSDAGKIILTLADNPGGAYTLGIVFHKYTLPNRIFKTAGIFFYAITYFDANTGWESPPIFSNVEITEAYLNNGPGTAFIKFTSLTAPQSILDTFPNLQIKVYRIPFGGSEYLLSKVLNGSVSNTFYDDTTDLQLGEVLPTEGNTDTPLESQDVVSIAIHKESLFVAAHNDRILYYSKPTKHNEFPAQNFFVFDYPIVGLASHNEHLAILTTQKIYIIYGSGIGFSVGKVDYNAGLIARNTGQSIAGQLFAMWSNGDSDANRRRGVLRLSGLRAVDIGLKIKDTLNTGTWFTGASSAAFANRNAVIDNRFYVSEIVDCKQTGDFTSETKIFNIVYDTYANGFCLYDSSLNYDGENCFVYRTKEFVANKLDNPRLTQYHKGIWIRGQGKFKVEFLGDGKVLTTASFDISEIDVVTTNVKNTRYNSFSLRFTGAKGAKIYDWGLLL
ncbi:MAG: hypothetical protein WC977_13565 [Anaerovoracaceae bacterium]